MKEITNISIEDPKYKKFNKAYNYAIEMIKRETRQAAEGMLHNLNSLQSRSGWARAISRLAA